MAKVLNIEIGDRISKVCVSEKRKKDYQISNCFLMPTPAGAVQDGQIINVDLLAEALHRELLEHGAANVKSVTVTLSSTKVASREVMLPPVKENRIRSVVETNKTDYFPVDMSGYCISHTLLERVGGENPGCRVQVTAAPRMMLEGYVALAAATGLRLEAVDYCGNSQYQVLRILSSEEVVMYVDVNVSNTLVSFMHGDMLMMQRNINMGGDELVAAVMEATGRDESEFLSVLERVEDADYLNTCMTTEQQEEYLRRLVSGISRSADFFKSNRSSAVISKVVLMGVCGSIAHLSEQVQAELGTETVTLKDINGINFVANSVGGVNSYISCIGSLVNPLDLLPEEMHGSQKKKKAKKARKKSDSIVGGVLLFLLLTAGGLALSAFSIMQYMEAEAEQKRLEQRLQELDYVRETVEVYEAYQITEATLQQLRAYSDSKNAYLVEFLEEMERKMPTSMLLMSAVCDEQGVTMNIVTPGLEEANVVIKQLRSFESIKNMSISTITENIDEGGVNSATFSIRCSYFGAADENVGG